MGNEVEEGGQMEAGACSSGEEGGEGGALGLLPPGAAQGQDGAKEDQEDKDLTGENKGQRSRTRFRFSRAQKSIRE